MLAVVEPADGTARVEDHRRSDHGTEKAAAADLIDAGDVNVSVGLEGVFEPPVRTAGRGSLGAFRAGRQGSIPSQPYGYPFFFRSVRARSRKRAARPRRARR